jgi:multiple sugar transport system permease protein
VFEGINPLNTLAFRDEIRGAMKKQKQRYNYSAYLYIAPILIGIMVFYLYAFFQNIWLSFNDVGIFGNRKFIGFGNYRTLFHDILFWRALKNTAFYAILGVPSIVILSIGLAWMLNQKIPAQSFFRTAIFIPAITLPAAIGLLWRWLYNSSFGLINHILGWFGIQPIFWLSDIHWVRWSILIVLIWASMSYMVIILLSGLQRIPSVYYDAAQVDGANTRQIFFRVTLPLLTPTIFFVSVVSMIGTFQIFDLIFLIIRPDSAAYQYANSLVTFFFQQAFALDLRGYGAAISVVSLILIFAVTAIQFRVQKRWVNYD